jgi:hypothetical protein
VVFVEAVFGVHKCHKSGSTTHKLWSPQICGATTIDFLFLAEHTYFMPSSDEEKNLKSEVAKDKPRDEHGHFIKDAVEAVKEATEITHNSKDDSKMFKVEVNDPSTKWYRLLQQIKEQKAFAFTLKGSLGLAGVVVALSVFGLFGGSKILCDKGTQTEIGLIKILAAKDTESSNIPIFGFIVNLANKLYGNETLHNRVILKTSTNSTISLPYTSKINFESYRNKEVFVTGSLDSCSRVLKAQSIETANSGL